MTVQELYDWAKERDVLNCELEVQYRDGGGEYSGTEEVCEDYIGIEHKDCGDVIVL